MASPFLQIDLFAGLPATELDALTRVAVPKRYAPGEHVFLEGELCAGLWVIAEGSVRIVKVTPSGRQIVLAMQSAPTTVAEVPVFDGGPYPATVTAIEPTTALLILTRDFLQICRRNPELALRVLSVFGSRLRHLVNLVERITFGSIRQRLAQELLAYSDAASNSRFMLAETHEELASRLGTVREVVSRNLGRFQSEGMLRVQRKDVEILDRGALLAEANTEL